MVFLEDEIAMKYYQVINAWCNMVYLLVCTGYTYHGKLQVEMTGNIHMAKRAKYMK